MSWTGLWLLGPIPDTDAHALRDRRPAPAVPAAELAWWRAAAEPLLGHRADGTAESTPLSERFALLVDSTRPDSSDADADAYAEEYQDSCLDLIQAGGTHYAAVTRKADPATALCYALGPDEALRLPGLFGDFLLTADELRATLPVFEDVLGPTGPRRRDVLARIADWFTAVGDAPGFDPAELLDEPLRVLRHAAATGCGAAAFSRIY